MNSKLILATLLLPVALFAAELPKEIPLWPKGAPGSEGKTEKELHVKNAAGEVTSVSRIHNPSLTPYLPAKDKANGCAVLVIPGGGHRVLAIQHEGYNVGEWLRERGIAAFVLKHRLARETNSTYQIEVESLADTQRAMRSGTWTPRASVRWASLPAANSRGWSAYETTTASPTRRTPWTSWVACPRSKRSSTLAAPQPSCR